MKTSLLFFALVAALVFQARADFAVDFKAARTLQIADKQTEARAAFQAIAARETGDNKILAEICAAISKVRSGDVDGGMSELLAMNTLQAKAAWVDVAVRVKKLPAESIESVAASVIGTPYGSSARYYLITAYITEKQWAKVSDNALKLASEDVGLLESLLPVITAHARDIFSAGSDQAAFYRELLRVIPAVEEHASLIGKIESQIARIK